MGVLTSIIRPVLLTNIGLFTVVDQGFILTILSLTKLFHNTL